MPYMDVVLLQHLKLKFINQQLKVIGATSPKDLKKIKLPIIIIKGIYFKNLIVLKSLFF